MAPRGTERREVIEDQARIVRICILNWAYSGEARYGSEEERRLSRQEERCAFGVWGAGAQRACGGTVGESGLGLCLGAAILCGNVCELLCFPLVCRSSALWLVCTLTPTSLS